MERKLASIQKIVSLDPIPNADRIEKATVLGWECVVEKGLHKVGDLVIYVEVDSILPERPEFEFMRPRNFRVKTIKLRKCTSQGLILPLSLLPNNKKGYKEGDDVTELLGITKYLTPTEREEERREAIQRSRINKFFMRYKWYRRVANLFRIKKDKGWPKFIKKTDEPRIQLFPHICENEKDTLFYASEKLNGTSASYFLIKQKYLFFFERLIFGVCSRNVYLKTEIHPNNYWDIARDLKIKDVLKNMIGNNKFIILQGEIIGPGIQDNKYKLKKKEFFAFNLIIPPYTFVEPLIAEEELCKNSISHVPILSIGYKLQSSISKCIERAEGRSLISNIPREGLVLRNYDKGLSFKIINPKYLLKYDE